MECLDSLGPYGRAWIEEVEELLLQREQDPARLVAELTQERSWVLLSWVEMLASEMRQEMTSQQRRLAIFALATLLRAEHLDARDVWVVGSVMRWATEAQGIAWEDVLASITLPPQADSLRTVSGVLPATHELRHPEVGIVVERRDYRVR